eukprot:1789386-Rhodomonas_salina.1
MCIRDRAYGAVRYACGTDIAYAAGSIFNCFYALVQVCYPRNPLQETAISVQFVRGMRFLVIELAVYPISGTDVVYGAMRCAWRTAPVLTKRMVRASHGTDQA